MVERNHDFEVVFKNIEAKCGNSASQIIAHAMSNDISKKSTKATDFYSWVNLEYSLGRGYAQALWIGFEELSRRKNLE